MNRFHTGKFSIIVHCLTVSQAQLESVAKLGGGGADLPEEQYDEIIRNVLSAKKFCQDFGLKDSAHRIGLSLNRIHGERRVNISALATELWNIQECMLLEAGKQCFLMVDPERVTFVDKSELFGLEVATAFPSAQTDLTEAGNCLAVECGTACVFHLMRAAEFALRALARDRRVEFSDKPLEEKEWGQVLPNLDAKITALRTADRKKWVGPDKTVRDSQIRFYSEAVQELRAFNDAWRRHVSHADTLAFYDRDMATAILNHVRSFMQKVAVKISETSITEEYWKSA